jgi:hypothetical protein
MKLNPIILTFFLISTAHAGFFCAEAMAQSQTEGTTLSQASASGVRVLKTSFDVGGKPVSLTAVRIAPRTRRLEIGMPEGSQSGDTLVGFQRRNKAVVAISGGFMKSYYPPIPLGMVKHAGTVLNRGVKSDLLTGILLAKGKKISIVPYSQDQCNSEWRECLQSGPLLASGGVAAKLLPDKTDSKSTQTMVSGRYIRAFVAILPGDEVLLGITGEVSLPALQEYLLRPANRGGLGCTAAINLSGNVSAGLLANIKGKQTSAGSIETLWANSIVIR